MTFLICKCKEPELILFSLSQLDYDFKNVFTGYTNILSGKPYFICINVKDKYYYIYSDVSNLCQSGLFNYVYLDNDEEILNKIGITDSIDKQRKLLENFVNLYSPTELTKFTQHKGFCDTLPEFFKIALENTEHIKRNDMNQNFENAIQPGRIVELEINNQCYLGIVLTSKTIMYVNSKGEIKGYINNFTMDQPYKINRIFTPTTNVFKLKDYKRMPIVWKRPERVVIKKSIKEIEAALGLEPGTLEIC